MMPKLIDACIHDVTSLGLNDLSQCIRGCWGACVRRYQLTNNFLCVSSTSNLVHFFCNIFSYLFITCDCFSGHLWMFKMDMAEITGSSFKTSVYLALKQPVTARTSFNWYANFGSHPFRPTDCKTKSLRSPPAHCWCWKIICSEPLCTETDFFLHNLYKTCKNLSSMGQNH